MSEQYDVPEMTFSSSPLHYPASSSPVPIIKQKRKLFQSFSAQAQTVKKPRTDEYSSPTLLNPPTQQNERIGLVSIVEETHPTKPAVDLDNLDDVLGYTTNIVDEPHESPTLLVRSDAFRSYKQDTVQVKTASGKKLNISLRTKQNKQTYEEIIAQRSVTAAGRAKKSYYGIDIHTLIDEAKTKKELDLAAAEHKEQNAAIPSVERSVSHGAELGGKKSQFQQMWTEKYRAKKFTELVGDERTHRSVLKWLKSWDSLVFPGNVKVKSKRIYEDKDNDQEKQHRKIMLLTGPPGLGKTTLAHVCAKQAGYEVLEINASDDRSRDVVRGRIKDALGTETVRGIKEHGKARKTGRPVCVVVDEVDGVVTGSGGSGGEGGFMKALIDLVQLDQKNSGNTGIQSTGKGGKKGDKFRMMRPLILICNDVYAPSLRPLRNSSLPEIIHVRKPPLEKVISRLRTVFEKEKIQCDNDAIRRLCESSWGLGSRKQNSIGARGTGEGDIRGILVQGEWAAHKLRSTTTSTTETRLTRKWVDRHLGESQTGQKGLGRGGVREVVERIFIDGAGLLDLPTTLSADEKRLISDSKAEPIGVADLRKRNAITALQEMINTCGDHDRLMSDCFATYPTRVYQDDTFLSKPNSSYDWLYFHDSLSSRIFSGQEWELNKYLGTSACAFHDLFATVDKGSSGWGEERKDNEEDADVHPFSGLKADFAAYEAEKQNRVVLNELQASFTAPMLRLFSSVDAITTELIPNLNKMLAPDVKPVVVGGSAGGASVASVRKESERKCVQTSVRAMSAVGVEFEKVRIENEGLGAHSNGGYALRMEPPIDMLNTFHISKPTSTNNTNNATSTTANIGPPAPVRYAVRQVLDQELRKEKLLQANLARHARSTKSLDPTTSRLQEATDTDADKENTAPASAPRSAAEIANAIKSKTFIIVGAGAIKRDFFGRPLASPCNQTPSHPTGGDDNMSKKKSRPFDRASDDAEGQGGRTWVAFHEGFSNAVRKPITLREFLDSF